MNQTKPPPPAGEEGAALPRHFDTGHPHGWRPPDRRGGGGPSWPGLVGAQVTVTLIEAEIPPEGAPDHVVHTVTEKQQILGERGKGGCAFE